MRRGPVSPQRGLPPQHIAQNERVLSQKDSLVTKTVGPKVVPQLRAVGTPKFWA